MELSQRELTDWWCICAQSLSCPTLCDPMHCSLPGSFCPWDFLGKYTGVGCHFLLQGNRLVEKGIKEGTK